MRVRVRVRALRASGAGEELDPELASFILVRVVLAVVQSLVVDRPKLNGPALVDELTRLVVGYVGLPLPARVRSRVEGT